MSGIHLECQYSNYSLINTDETIIDEAPACFVLSMDFSDNATHITSASGSAEQIQTAEIIIFGWTFNTPCRELNLTFVPKGFLNVFPNMNGLQFRECEITNLTGNELDEYPNFLKWLISYSQITTVPGNLFANNPNLRIATFSNNGILRVGDGLADHLRNLEFLWFLNEGCISRTANSLQQVQQLIQDLRLYCPDVDPTTTPATTPSSAKLNDPLIKLIFLVILIFVIKFERA